MAGRAKTAFEKVMANLPYLSGEEVQQVKWTLQGMSLRDDDIQPTDDSEEEPNAEQETGS